MFEKIRKNICISKHELLALLLLFCLVIIIFAFSFSYANPLATPSVTITSENLSYDNHEAGAWRIVKSAKWVSKGKAEITLDVDSVIKTRRKYSDVIIVLDTSGSMNEERLVGKSTYKTKLSKAQEDCENLIRNNLADSNNHVALINFSSDSNIVSNLTNDEEALISGLYSLQAEGNTNYYQALVNVENVLNDYVSDDEHDLVVLFLTDGYPNIDVPNEISQYNYLKSKYPDMAVNGILYDLNDDSLGSLKSISDKLYIADNDNLSDFLYLASVFSLPYEEFTITDYINSDYFDIESVESVESSFGSYNVDLSIDEPKVTWDLSGIYTGDKAKMKITVVLKNSDNSENRLYPTNKRVEVQSTLKENTENVVSDKTPILSDNYFVTYVGNAPSDCKVSNIPDSERVSVFDNVKISDVIPSCFGHQFEGWEISTDGVEKTGNDSFVMPEENVEIKATWSKVSINKSMDGKPSVTQSLYNMMADNSVMDNIKSEYVSSDTGIDFSKISSDTNGKGIYELASTASDTYPVYYYRGDISNNNVVFANYCWKIVRTTSTGGVKMIYNGKPGEDGSCTAMGADVSAGTSGMNGSDSMAYAGYMYGNVYKQNTMTGSIVGLGGKKESKVSSISSSNYLYASDVTYDEATGLYSLNLPESRIWNDTYAVNDGNQYLYTCLSETENTCSTVYFVTRSNDVNNIYYTEFTNGEKSDIIMESSIVYGNDAVYDSNTGLYTLVTTFSSKIGDYNTDYKTIAGATDPGYHYTCLSSVSSCEKVKYIYYFDGLTKRSISNFYYVEMSSGKKISDLIEEMTTGTTNTNDSSMKRNIENWYANNLLDYADYLEDTVWCNERKVALYNGWDKDGNATDWVVFQGGNNLDKNKPTVECSNLAFMYTTSAENGNGKLKYPIALLTADEVTFAGGRIWRLNSNFYLYSNSYWWTLTPYYVAGLYGAGGLNLYSNGDLDTSPLYYGRSMRPAISLKAGIKSVDGDGTPNNPYIVG